MRKGVPVSRSLTAGPVLQGQSRLQVRSVFFRNSSLWTDLSPVPLWVQIGPNQLQLSSLPWRLLLLLLHLQDPETLHSEGKFREPEIYAWGREEEGPKIVEHKVIELWEHSSEQERRDLFRPDADVFKVDNWDWKLVSKFYRKRRFCSWIEVSQSDRQQTLQEGDKTR